MRVINGPVLTVKQPPRGHWAFLRRAACPERLHSFLGNTSCHSNIPLTWASYPLSFPLISIYLAGRKCTAKELDAQMLCIREPSSTAPILHPLYFHKLSKLLSSMLRVDSSSASFHPVLALRWHCSSVGTVRSKCSWPEWTFPAGSFWPFRHSSRSARL